jgi:O-succinylbenzoate synthase
MKIESAELRVIHLDLLHPFETSFGVETARTVPILRLFAGGLEGVSEGVMDSLPLFREETIAGALDLLKHTLLPLVLGQEIVNPQDLVGRFAPFRGNRMAKAMLEMAFWDLWARSLNLPLGRLLGGTRTEIAVGVSLGIQPSLDATREQVEKHLAQGYRRIKLKIKPGWDVNLIASIRAHFPDAVLTVDANSCYTPADFGVLRTLDQFGLDYIEQPLAYDDIFDHAQLQSRLQTAICLDESILSPEDTRKALQAGAGRVINIKVARVGGHLEARRTHDVALAFGVPVWCGGMLESGIGRAHNIHLASLPNFTKPGDTSSASRYWKRDIISEALETRAGWMPVPTGPGIGVTLDLSFLNTLTLQKETFPV